MDHAAARRQAYVARIRQVLADIANAHTIKFAHGLRWDFEARFESAMEDAFQMGMREQQRLKILAEEAAHAEADVQKMDREFAGQ